MSRVRRPTIEIEGRGSRDTASIRRPHYLLPGAEHAPIHRNPASRFLAFVKETWGGRMFLAALLCGFAESALSVSIPLPWKTALVVIAVLYGRAMVARAIRSLFYRVRSKLLMDAYWGSSSHTTVFRNRIANQPFNNGQEAVQYVFIFDIWKNNRSHNIVGNVVGSIGMETALNAPDGFPYGGKYIYRNECAPSRG